MTQAIVWLRNVGDEDESWVPCAKGDPGAVAFAESGPAQKPSTDAIAGIMIREMFAPHELPLDEELTGKYQALAGKIVAALAPQPALEPETLCETCPDCGVREPCDDDCPNHVEPELTAEQFEAYRNLGIGVYHIPVEAAPSPALEPSQAQISQLDDASNACLELAAKHGFATGHGDTVADMIREFSTQISKSPALEPVTVEAKHWRCFFCDEVFTDDKAAAHHFGGEICGEPLCKLAQVDGGIAKVIADLAYTLHGFQIENNASFREFYALGADHRAALIKDQWGGRGEVMTLSYRCSNCGTDLMTTNADPLNDEIERLRHALGNIRIYANGPGDRRLVVDKIYDLATKALRGPVAPAERTTPSAPGASAPAQRLPE